MPFVKQNSSLSITAFSVVKRRLQIMVTQRVNHAKGEPLKTTEQ